jgi:hypothetical protein
MEEYTLDDPNVEMLDENIFVFHNTLEDPDAYIDYFEEYGSWRGWYGFGRQIDGRGQPFGAHPTFPTWDEWLYKLGIMYNPEEDNGLAKDIYAEEVAKIFHLATKFYIEQTGRSLPNYTCQPWGLARYIPDENLIDNEELTMNYHTDYMPEDAESPGDKFGITGVLYPNDDYEGGGLIFKVVQKDGSIKEFNYKPKAGDLVVFPSGPPYYHGVERIYGSPKYITRLYWMYHFEGTDTWHELAAKYGDKFEQMEKDRRSRRDIRIMTPYMRLRFTLKEYYDLLESGELKDLYED